MDIAKKKFLMSRIQDFWKKTCNRTFIITCQNHPRTS